MWELNRVSEVEFKQQKHFPVVVVLDSIRSLSNIGAFFRTADAFNVEKIYLCGISATPPHKEIHKTAIGATESVEWEYVKDAQELVKILKSQGYTVLCVEQTEKTIPLQDLQTVKGTSFALLFGNEVDGVDQTLVDLSDHVLEIPQFGTKHSLNVSVCAGIVLWEMVKRWIPKKG